QYGSGHSLWPLACSTRAARHSAWLEVVIPKIFWQEQEEERSLSKPLPKSRKTLLRGRSSDSATTTTDNPCSTHNRTLGLYAHLSGRIASHGYPLSQERFAPSTVHPGDGRSISFARLCTEEAHQIAAPPCSGIALGFRGRSLWCGCVVVWLVGGE
uniref:Uncharacterized protein n=1 Tax=Anopheles quadriannulatus TaxID=34691 RepID=A0A182XM42_ANOQN